MEYLNNFRGYKVAKINGTDWIRIFHHDVTNFKLFSVEKSKLKAEISFINETDRFSVLGFIDERFHINNTFVFMYYQPLSYPNDFFFFNQTNNPFRTKIATDVSFKPTFNECKIIPDGKVDFTGFTVSEDNTSYMDANSYGNHWHYAIGATELWPNNTVNEIPGAPCQAKRKNRCNELWIRYNDLNVLFYLPLGIHCSLGRIESWYRFAFAVLFPILIDPK